MQNAIIPKRTLSLNDTPFSEPIPCPSWLNPAPDPSASSVKPLRFAPMNAEPAGLTAQTDRRLPPPVCALNFPIAMNPGLAKALGVMMKLDFQRSVLNRIPVIETHPERYFRQVFFLCDEYQHFATVGENEPTGDEKFFSLSRQPKCIPIVATQSISSLKSTLPGDSWRTLLQTFRTKIFLTLSDDFSARTASELCGKEDRLKASYNLSESGHDASISLLTGRAISHRANLTASKSYYPQSDFRFDTKTFTELKNAQSVVIAYDGFNPMPPAFCYLKPYFNDPNKSYFQQLEEGLL
jgi:hypothetical protein